MAGNATTREGLFPPLLDWAAEDAVDERATVRLMRQEQTPKHGRPGSPFIGIRAALAEFAYGMSGYEFARHAIETRAALENLFMVVVVGDMIGLPVIPPYYSLRLLPFVTPQVATWKRRVLREREFTDQNHLHGV
jgi:hypothetical protein